MAIKLEGNGINYQFPLGNRGRFDIRGYPRTVSVPGQKVHGRDGEVTDTRTVSRNALSLEVFGTLKSNSLASAREAFNEITNAVNSLPNEVYLVQTDDDIRIPVRMDRFTHTREPAQIMVFSVMFKAAFPFWESRDYSEVTFTSERIVDVPIGNAPLYPDLMLKGPASNPTIVQGNWSFNSHIANLKANAMTDGASVDPYGEITGTYTETDIKILGAVSSPVDLNGAQGVVGIDKNMVYVAASSADALTVVNVASPATPSIVTSLSSVDLNGAFGVYVPGATAYVACSSGDGLAVITLASPATPAIYATLSSTAVLGEARNTMSTGNYVLMTSFTNNILAVITTASPATPAILGSVASAAAMGSAWGLDLNGDNVFVTGYGTDSLAVIDISSPSTPSVLGSVASAAVMDGPKGVQYLNGKVCVAAENSDSLVVIDVSSPATPAILGSLASAAAMGSAFNIDWQAGNYVYVTGQDKIAVVDISAPATPEIVSSVSTLLNDTLTVLNTDGTATESIVSSKYGYARDIDYKDSYTFSSLYQRGDKLAFVVKLKPEWASTSVATRYIFELQDTDGGTYSGLHYRNGRLVFGAESTIGGAVTAFAADANVEFSGWCDADGTLVDGTTYYAKLFQDGSEIASVTTMLKGCNGTLTELHIGTRMTDNDEEIVKADVDELYLYNQNVGDNYCKGETVYGRAINPDNVTFKWASTLATNDHLDIDMENYKVTKYDVSANSTSNELGNMSGNFFMLGKGSARTGHDKNKSDTITLAAPATGEIKYRNLYW